ncbi:hypothetical protein L6164_015299 [Bauhinia variegata]|uniref:Uncharacterized protein n=1 Tax=Bauhinia variegata TaxID=167791 RepID=A0ACB9NLX0_BAUVA|nr:hypothetical protein L6164_015299 [Bauhinia variegata]
MEKRQNIIILHGCRRLEKKFVKKRTKRLSKRTQISSCLLTLHKPDGTEDESRRSSTCQPGRVSIKYSDMLLVEPTPSGVNKPSPALLMVGNEIVVADIVAVAVGEFFVTKIGEFEKAVEGKAEFFHED